MIKPAKSQLEFILYITAVKEGAEGVLFLINRFKAGVELLRDEYPDELNKLLKDNKYTHKKAIEELEKAIAIIEAYSNADYTEQDIIGQNAVH